MSLLNAFTHDSIKIVDEHIADRSRQLLEGWAPDYPAYREKVGELRALALVRQIFEEVYAKINKES